MIGPSKHLLKLITPKLVTKVIPIGRWQGTLSTAAVENSPEDAVDFNTAKDFKDMPGPSYLKAIWPMLVVQGGGYHGSHLLCQTVLLRAPLPR